MVYGIVTRVAVSSSSGSGTKARMLDSAALLLRERGVGGVTVDAVLAHSGAPRGSVYHHFPGGRDELLLGALTQAGAFVTGRLERAVERGDARQAVASFVRFWTQSLTDSDFRAGCPAVAAAVDGRLEIPGAAEAVRAVFDQWRSTLIRLLVADGYPRPRAERLATMTLAAVEGAIILCRAGGDVRALEDVAAELDLMLTHDRKPSRG